MNTQEIKLILTGHCYCCEEPLADCECGQDEEYSELREYERHLNSPLGMVELFESEGG